MVRLECAAAQMHSLGVISESVRRPLPPPGLEKRKGEQEWGGKTHEKGRRCTFAPPHQSSAARALGHRIFRSLASVCLSRSGAAVRRSVCLPFLSAVQFPGLFPRCVGLHTTGPVHSSWSECWCPLLFVVNKVTVEP